MDEKLFLCKVTDAGLDEAMEMIDAGKAFLRSQGIDQWQTGYPDRETLMGDIDCGKGYFLTDGKNNMAYMCLDTDGEPAYDDIKGQWLTAPDAKYMVIHRMAFSRKFRGRGLATEAFRLAEVLCAETGIGSIRVDTNPENKIMQNIMKKNGFAYCGTIWFVDGDKLAYEKVVENHSGLC